jgi:CRP-like cAMP-binding protein
MSGKAKEAAQESSPSIAVNILPALGLAPLIEASRTERKVVHFRKRQKVYVQGELADSVYILQHGRVKICVVSPDGKEATLSIHMPGDCFGESCLSAQPLRTNSAVALTDCTLLKINKPCLAQALRQETQLSEAFLAHVLNRNLEYQQALRNHIIASSEQRLAAILIRLGKLSCERQDSLSVVPRLSHQTLAEMTGTTRPRITFFMNKFRKQGFIHYNDHLLIDCEKLAREVVNE